MLVENKYEHICLWIIPHRVCNEIINSTLLHYGFKLLLFFVPRLSICAYVMKKLWKRKFLALQTTDVATTMAKSKHDKQEMKLQRKCRTNKNQRKIFSEFVVHITACYDHNYACHCMWQLDCNGRWPNAEWLITSAMKNFCKNICINITTNRHTHTQVFLFIENKENTLFTFVL